MVDREKIRKIGQTKEGSKEGAQADARDANNRDILYVVDKESCDEEVACFKIAEDQIGLVCSDLRTDTKIPYRMVVDVGL